MIDGNGGYRVLLDGGVVNRFDRITWFVIAQSEMLEWLFNWLYK